MRSVHVVVPGDIDDVAVPSGGNTYDRRVCAGLSATGATVRMHAVRGGWPRPDGTERAALADVLAGLPDGAVVLIDGLVACGVPEVVVPAARRLRVVVLVHLPLGDEAGLPPAEAADRSARERATLHAAGAVVATGPWTARRLVELHGLARVDVAIPGVDPAPLAAGSGGTNLLCVGSVTPTKGHDLLVEALADVVDLPWSCTVVGSLQRDPAHVETVRAEVERRGLGDRVRLAGPLVGAPLADAYAAADLLVHPSRVEAYGMVVTEALARGVPVLATQVGGLADALGGDADGAVPGMLVAPGGLAAALRRWCAEPDLRAELRRRAVARRATLTGWEETARQVVEVLAGVASPT